MRIGGGPGRALLFDLDGTLIDTAEDLCVAASAVAQARGSPAVPLAQIRPHVSRGGSAMLAAALPQSSAAERAALIEEFLAVYGASIARHSTLFPGLDALLRRCEAVAVPWGIVTNKPDNLAIALLEALDLSSRCAVLISGDTLAVKKPSPEPLFEACRRLGVKPAACIYVGDDRRDVDAAVAAGMPVVAAGWGYRTADDRIEDWPADRVVEHSTELENALAQMWAC